MPTPAQQADMENEGLVRRIQDLPPELHDMIFSLVFAADVSIRTIDENYKPPPLLAVDRRSREIYAKAYYGSTDSLFICNASIDTIHDTLIPWLKSVPESHLRMIRHLKITCKIDHGVSGTATIQHVIQYFSALTMKCLESNGLGILRGKLYTEVHVQTVDGEEMVLRS